MVPLDPGTQRRRSIPHFFQGGGNGSIVLVHIVALFSIAITLPLLEVLGRSPEFFVAHRLERIDLAVFVLIVAGVGPALAVAAAWAAGHAGSRLMAWTAGIIRTVLTAAVVLQAIKGLPAPGVALVLVALVSGVAVDLVCRYASSASLFVALLSPAMVIAPALFCLRSPASRLLAPPQDLYAGGEANHANSTVVFVVFDQLPLTSLLDGNGDLDAKAFPHFAALAGTSIWFRETYSVSDRTEFALPAILTGRYPRAGQMPTASGHPGNLFTGLAPSYRLHVQEPLTRLCPPWLCADETPLASRLAAATEDASLVYLHQLLPADLSSALPDVRWDWRGFWRQSVQERWGRARRADRRPHDWISAIDRSRGQPTLHFLHVLLPHEPFVHLPTGQAYPYRRTLPVLVGDEEWIKDEWVVADNYQRHLLQVGAADHFLGLLVDRLEQLGMFDETLIVVTSDHGASFRAGKHFKRPDADNFADIMSVPFLLKLPRQKAGRVSRRPTETVDILPTLLDALSLDHQGQPEGRSALDESGEPRRDFRMYYYGATATFSTTADRLASATLESARRKIDLFGPGPAWHRKTDLGSELVGRPVSAFRVIDEPLIGIWLQAPELYTDVDPTASVVPALIRGDVRGRTAIVGQTLAVAVNGIVLATTHVVIGQAKKPHRGTWSVVVSPDGFRRGPNEIEVYQVEAPEGTGSPVLRRVVDAGK